MRDRSLENALAWAVTIAGGAWLSVQTARRISDWARSPGRPFADGEVPHPVREIVEGVLAEHRAEVTAAVDRSWGPGDGPMVEAFEAALEEAEEEAATAA